MLSHMHTIFCGLQEHIHEALHNLPSGIDLCIKHGLCSSQVSWVLLLIWPIPLLYLGHIYVCVIFNHVLAHISAVLDLRITYKGLKLDFKNDPILLVDLDKSKSHLREYYNKYYAVSPAPPRDTNNACLKLSSTSDFTAHYESIIPDLINKLYEYLKIKCKDFKKCNPLRWWRSQHKDWPNLYYLACDILCIPGLSCFILLSFLCLYIFRLCCCYWTHFFQQQEYYIDLLCQPLTRDNPHTHGPEASLLSDVRG